MLLKKSLNSKTTIKNINLDVKKHKKPIVIHKRSPEKNKIKSKKKKLNITNKKNINIKTIL